MTASWNKIPRNPEKDGPHWIGVINPNTGEVVPYILHWVAAGQVWICEPEDGETYLGPALTPAEVAAQTAAAALSMRNAAVALAERPAHKASKLAAEIAALAIPSGATPGTVQLDREAIRREAFKEAEGVARELCRAAAATQTSTRKHSGPGQAYDWNTLEGRYYAGNAAGGFQKALDIADALKSRVEIPEGPPPS